MGEGKIERTVFKCHSCKEKIDLGILMPEGIV